MRDISIFRFVATEKIWRCSTGFHPNISEAHETRPRTKVEGPAALGANVSAHFTRIGACQDLVKAASSMPAIMQAGGWKTAAMLAAYNSQN